MYSFKFLVGLLFFFFHIVVFSFLFSYTPSDERLLFKDISLLSLSHSINEVKASIVKLLQTDKMKFVRSKTRVSKEIEEGLLKSFLPKDEKKGAYYDKDFLIYFSSDKSPSFSFTLLKSYDIISNFHSWNKLVAALELSFFKDILFEKELSLEFSNISEVLVLLVEIRNKMGKADINSDPINYSAKNRFVWNNNSNDIYIEFIFLPHNNIFKQLLGYKGTLIIRDRVIGVRVNNYVIKVKKNLRKVLSR